MSSYDLKYALRHIGCFENGDAPCTCNIGHDAADRIDILEAERDALAEKLAKAVGALEDVAGVGFDAPMTWAGTDADWERKRANAMQWRARDTLAELKGKTDDHTD